MKLKGFLENSLLDWDGKISAVLFLSGCNYACPFCHNPELAGDSQALPELPLAGVLERAGKIRNWLDGVVVTGGEPCICPELEGLLSDLRRRGFRVKLDTNGSNPEMLARVLEKGLVDYVAMDVKAPFEPGKYARLSGVPADPEEPRASAALLEKSGVEHEFRTTVVPGWLPEEDLTAIAAALGPRARYYLQRFRNEKTLDPELSLITPGKEEDLQHAASACGRYVAHCGVR